MPDAPSLSVRADDRTLNVWLAGAESGEVLLLQLGTPEPPVPWPAMERLAADLDLRLVSYARPGYSGSTRDEGRSVADAADDVAAILDALDTDTFVTIGHSGGGPHALACAALLPNRCRATATLGSVAPYDLFDGEWLAGMAEENVEEFGMVLDDPDGLEDHLARALGSFESVTSAEVAHALGGLASDVDRGALTGELAEMMAACLRRAAVDGLYGWVDDDLAFVEPWGFSLDSIETPVTVWQGRQDRMVPFEHGQWLVGHIRGAEPRLLEDEGHISLMTRRLRDIVTGLIR